MLISYSHNFLFIHTPKAAGTSIQRALQDYGQFQDKSRLNKIRSALRLHRDHKNFFIREHATASQIKALLPDAVFSTLFKFAFVRNPWDLLYSSYRYILQNNGHHRHKKVTGLGSFDAFIDYEIRRNKLSQSSFIADRSGNSMIDFMGRFEHLHEDFEEVCRQLRVKATLPHVNRSRHNDYRQAYSGEMRDKVARHWKQDIELLGYEFE